MDLESFLVTASQLLAVPSTGERPEELQRALDFVLDFVGPGFTVERFESGGRPSALVYAAAERPQFAVILNAHLDVVPAPAHQFLARRHDDRLLGRGTQDMKVSGLVQALAFRELAGEVPYPLGLQLVTDEEVGGRDGTQHQLQQGVASRFAVMGESSGLSVVIESKGVLRVRLQAQGRSAHAAYPWLGDNALLKLQRSIDRILSAYPVPPAEAWRTTVNLARVHTPNQAINQVPDSAEAWLDVRFPAGDPDLAGRTDDQVTAYLTTLCEPGVSPVIDRLEPPHHADRQRPEIGRLQAAARGQGYSGGFLRKHGSGDSRFYSAHGMTSVSFGIGGGGQHGPDEYADITTIAPYYRALTEFLRDPGA